jgi:D-apionolactonase
VLFFGVHSKRLYLSHRKNKYANMQLKAGLLQVSFENGALRHVRLRGREVLRSIYFALRDQNWGTIPFRIEQWRETIGADHFDIGFEAVHYLGDADVFSWQVNLRGGTDHTLDFSLVGTALQDFSRNRAGFCVLHPVEECAGAAVRITAPDGSTTDEVFPLYIAPERPFPLMSGMEWSPEDGSTARLVFEGDVFETEDHRNWTDTSYKTFCTPLSQPRPVLLRAGEQVRQRVRLEAVPSAAVLSTSKEDTLIQFTPTERRLTLPRIGTQLAFGQTPFSGQEAATLSMLQLDHLRVEVRLHEVDWQTHLLFAATQAQRIDTGLFIALTFGVHAIKEANDFIGYATLHQLNIRYLLLFKQNTYATPSDLLEAVVPILRAGLPQVQIGAGTQTNYAELGRNLFKADMLDFVAYGIHPQEHAFDDLSLVENIESQADTVRSARVLYPGKSVIVSPLTLKQRFNPYARDAAEHFTERPVAMQADRRYASKFTGAWLLGSLFSLADGGAAAVTVFRATGPLGLCNEAGQLTSAGRSLIDLYSAARQGDLYRLKSSDKLRAEGVSIVNEHGPVNLIVNYVL